MLTREENIDSVSNLLTETFVMCIPSFSVTYFLRVLELRKCKWRCHYICRILSESSCIFPGNVLVLVLRVIALFVLVMDSDGTVLLRSLPENTFLCDLGF